MLAIVDFKASADLHSHIVRDGTSDKDSTIYCRCDTEEKAQMIAMALNAVYRLREAGALVQKTLKMPRFPTKEE